MFDTTSINKGIRKGVTVCLERAFGNNLLQLAHRNYGLELLCGAAVFLVYSMTKSPNEPPFISFSTAGLVLINWTSMRSKQKVGKKRLNVKMSLVFAELHSLMMPPEKTFKKF